MIKQYDMYSTGTVVVLRSMTDNFASICDLVVEAQRDFPGLRKDDISIAMYPDGTMGIEFTVFGTNSEMVEYMGYYRRALPVRVTG